MSSELKILTFNVWGLAFVTKDRRARLAATAAFLAQADYDIVCLQEIWIHKEFESMRQDVQGNYQYSRFFHTGALGSGLCVFSRLPIVEAKALPYSLSGLPSEVIAGDFFVNKAASRTVVLHPELGEVEIYNTHMHAAGENPPDTRQAHRMTQAWELATEVRRGASTGRYIFCMGDFNSQPYSVPIALLTTYGGLRDSFLETHPHANDSHAVGISSAEAISTLGMTCDSMLNSYSADKNIPDNVKAQGGKRLDYIFYREGRSPTFNVRCSSSEVVQTGLVPGQNFSFSDHFALTSTFRIDRIREHDGESGSLPSGPSSRAHLLPLGGGSSDDQSDRPASPTSAYELARVQSSDATASAIRTALATLRDYASLAGKRTRQFDQFLVLCVVAVIALAVGSAWQPKSWIQPIFTILTFVLGAAGATFLYSGWLWGRWERGILDETMADMELELRVLDRA